MPELYQYKITSYYYISSNVILTHVPEELDTNHLGINKLKLFIKHTQTQEEHL